MEGDGRGWKRVEGRQNKLLSKSPDFSGLNLKLHQQKTHLKIMEYIGYELQFDWGCSKPGGFIVSIMTDEVYH